MLPLEGFTRRTLEIESMDINIIVNQTTISVYIYMDNIPNNNFLIKEKMRRIIASTVT